MSAGGGRGPVTRGSWWRVLLTVMSAVALAACGVEVPDDVAERAAAETTTTEVRPSTTDVPMSDDELEQALIDNGYSLEEARCGAERLRADLPDDEIREIIEAESITDISPRAAADFAAALRPCVTGEGPPSDDRDGDGDDEGDDDGDDDDGDDDDGDDDDGDDDDGDDDGDEDDDEGGGRLPGRPGGGAMPGVPGLGDRGLGDVTPGRFLAALLAAGVADQSARCIVAGVFDAFEQDVINDIFRAPSPDALPRPVEEEIDAIVEGCR